MHSLIKIVFAATAILAVAVSATPLAQTDQPALVNGLAQATETVVPQTQAYEGVDPGPLPVPKTTASPTPSPRFYAPIKIASEL